MRDIPVLAVESVTVRFGPVVALDGVSLEVGAGEVVALLGDNGAGKSTLLGVVSGAARPDGGAVVVDGRPVALGSPRAARVLGIALVPQDLGVLPLMSVWRNVILGAEPIHGRGLFGRLDHDRARDEATGWLARLDVAIDDPDRLAGTLSGGERQAVALARALRSGARALLLDEPTAALGVRQTATVLDRVRRLAESGAAILLVTHRPDQALAAADRFVTLCRGRVTGAGSIADQTVEGLATMMRGAWTR